MRKLLNTYNKREDGFTLIELLIVVLIIGILAAIAIPVYLGLQQQAHKTTTRADVANAVKRVQVNLTEGATVNSLYGTNAGSDRGATVQVKASTTAGAGANDFMVVGIQSKNATPAAASINYSYVYDSVTGQFSEYDNNDQGGVTTPTVAITTTALADGSSGVAYSQPITVTNTNTTGTNVFTSTTLPAGLSIDTATGLISGTPTTGNAGSVTVTVTNGTATNAKTFSLNIAGPIVTAFEFNSGAVPASFILSGVGNVTVSNGSLNISTLTSSNRIVQYNFTLPKGGSITIADQASSEGGYDFGRWTVDGNQGSQKSGTSYNYGVNTMTLAAGSHTLLMTYSKDGSVDSGGDTYIIDYIRIAANQ